MLGYVDRLSRTAAQAVMGALGAALVVISLVSFAADAVAQDIRTEDVRFAPGASATTIRDTIVGYESVSYRIGAEAGQTLRVSIEASNGATYFNVYAPGDGPGDAAIANSGLTGPEVPEINRFEGVLQTSGEHTVSVYMMRSAARREEVSNYTLEIAIDGDTGPSVQADYADGLQGGPDFWQVRTSGGALNLRAGPSAAAASRGSFADGVTLRNLGCRMAEGRRWCNVATPDDTTSGWVAGDFLVEGTPPTQTSSPPMTRTDRVRFAPGTSGAVLRAELDPGDARNYMLGAESGQVLTVQLDAEDPQMQFNIFAPDGELLYDTTNADARSYRGQLSRSGDHVVQVFYLGQSPNVPYQIEFVID